MATPISILPKSYYGTSYFVGDKSNVRVRSIEVTYDDGTTETIKSGYTVSQVDTSEAGEKISIVEYSGLTAELAVTVVDSYNVQAGTPNLEDVNITFDLETGLLKVTGTGEFLSFSNIKNTPSSIKTRIKKVNIGNGITKIPVSAFGGNENLEDISFPNTLEEICDGNFYSTKITQIVFPQSLKKIGQSCFSSSALISLEIPDSVLEIGSSSFSNLSSLKKVIFHEGLETISPVAFNECPLITELSLPSTLKNMQYSFQGSTLEHLEIGGDGALFATSGSTYINNISAKNTVIRGGTIDNGAFYNNSTIENLALSGSVKLNGVRQFYSCPKLSSVSLENGITRIPAYCFSSCSKITEITIPASVTSIEESAFSDTSLKNLEIANGVKFIWKLAFSNTQLANVLIPASVIKIDKNAFSTKVTTNIALNKKTNEISGSPWGATGTITWLVRVEKLEITHMPTKVKYLIGEAFDSTGLVVTAYYNNNTSGLVPIGSIDSSFPNILTKRGNNTITFEFDEQSASFDVLAIDIDGIEIETLPRKLKYYSGDSFDSTGLSILVKYTDGTSEIKTTGYEISGFDSGSVGEKTITVTYKTHTATFKVTVYDLSGIRITSFPSKIYYKIGELFDPSGLTVAEVRQDGTEKEITDYDISGFDSSTAGPKTITVSYNVTVNGVSKFVGSDSFQIKVTNDGKNPFDDSSSGGSGEVEEEKTEPINVTVHWINGEFADLTNENIDQHTITLQESICSEQYFIFGGCVCNQITFQAHHDQFNGTSEEFYPSGKIEVYIERKGTRIKIFTGEIDSAERKANSLTRNFIAYDYLYKLRNTDIARWYKNQTTDKKKKLTQKQFRDKLFEFLGLEQVSTKLHWDDTYVPDTNNSNEMNVVNILKDLCLQNDRFGWMNRDGKFEYLKLRQNSYRYGQTTGNQNIYKYYNNEEIHLDTFKSFTAKEGRIWFPNIIFCDPDPNRAFGFTQGDYTAQEAYDNNVYYNRNSFFVGNEDWLNYVWDADEYGGISRAEPIIKICYGVFVNQDLRKYYRAQGYTAEVQGNPLNMVGQAVELYYKKQIQHDDQEPTELQWYVHSYIMSRTLKIGVTDMIDTYSANNAPFNSNSQQLGKYTPEISATVNRTRSEMPTISYAEFTDGSDSEFSPATIDDFTDGSGGSGSTSEQLKKAQLRCVKRIKKADYDALVAAGTDRTDTLYFTFEEG
nr:MAG TPA_asm: leucine rich repeat protein [Caudoviricetes sp.]